MKTNRSLNVAKVMILAVLAPGLGTGMAQAQNVVRGKFTLPFEARWGTATLPPGDYTFELNVASQPFMVAVRDGDHPIVLAMANSFERGKTSGSSVLTTERSGWKYRVSGLYLAEAILSLDFTPAKAERPILAEGPILVRRVPILTASK